MGLLATTSHERSFARAIPNRKARIAQTATEVRGM